MLPAAGQPLRFESVPGLSQNTVYSLMKDRMGFLWMATADGLNRYDGVEMKYYKPYPDDRPGGYKNRFVRTRLVEDDSGFIWFSSGAGLYSYDTRKDYFRLRPVPTRSGKSYWPLDPHYLLRETFWASHPALGLVAYNRQNDTWKVYAPPRDIASHPFSRIHYDSSGRFWCLGEQGIFLFYPGKLSWQQLYPERRIVFFAASREAVFLLSGDRLYQTSQPGAPLRSVEVRGFSGPLSFRASCTDRQGNLWLGDEAGNLFCKQPREDFIEWRGNINPAAAGTRYPVYSLLADENDILWVGADVLGLLRAPIRPVPFSAYPPLRSDGLRPGLFIHSIWEEGDEVWLGTFRKGLWKLNRITGQAAPVALPVSSSVSHTVSLVRKDSRGNLWLGVEGEALMVRSSAGSPFRTVKILPPAGSNVSDLRFFAMAERNDSLFFSCSWGLYVIVAARDGFRAVLIPGPGTGYYYDLHLEPAGAAWLATDDGVLYKPDLFSSNTPENGTRWLFRHTGIKSFTADPQWDLLWIASTSGLIAYRRSTDAYRIYTEADGLVNSYVYAALPSGDQLWLSTNQGLSCAHLRYPSVGSWPELNFTSYHVQDGLPAGEFNTGAYHAGGSGHLYFGTVEGVTWFRPGEVRPNRSLPRLVMTGLLVNEERPDSLLAAEYVRRLDLPYNRNNLFFRFRGIEYNNPSGVRYAYKLENWDKDWIEAGKLNQVRYNGLSPGRYLFRVRASNGAGIWNEEPYTIVVEIHPPFWQTGWFRGLLGLLLLGAIIGITRYVSQRKLKRRVALLEAQRQLDLERQRISREMHDDIGSGLTQIALMSESARRKATAAEEKELADIGETSRRLVGSMNEIIWSLNPENKTLAQLLAYLREQLHRQLEYAGLDYTIEFPDAGEDVLLRNEQRRNLLLVMREMVNNAIKYSGARRLVIRASLIYGGIQFDVSDDGKGFDPATVSTGNGLKNIRHRVEELNGTLELDTALGKGCRYRFRIAF